MPTATKRMVRKSAAKHPVKKTAKKSSRKEVIPQQSDEATPGQRGQMDFDVHGFRIGSDSALVVNEMVAGGGSRKEIADRILEKMPTTITRTGQPKNVLTMMSSLLTRLKDRGYEIDSHWRLIPPPEGSNGVPRPKIGRPRKQAAESAPVSTAKKSAKKTAGKKTTTTRKAVTTPTFQSPTAKPARKIAAKGKRRVARSS